MTLTRTELRLERTRVVTSLATTVAFLVLCLVGIALGIKALLRPVASSPAIQTPVAVYERGDSIDVPTVDFGTSERTLVVVIRKGCQPCEANMPFYREIAQDADVARQTRLIVVAPDPESVSREELARHDVRVDAIVSVPLSELKVRATPTAILVDRSAVVQRVEAGWLDETRRNVLKHALKTGS